MQDADVIKKNLPKGKRPRIEDGTTNTEYVHMIPCQFREFKEGDNVATRTKTIICNENLVVDSEMDARDERDDEEALENELMHDLSQKTSAKPAHATYGAHRTGWASATWLELAYGNDIAPLIDLYQAVKATPSLEVVSKFLEKISKETNFSRPFIHKLQQLSGKASATDL